MLDCTSITSLLVAWSNPHGSALERTETQWGGSNVVAGVGLPPPKAADRPLTMSGSTLATHLPRIKTPNPPPTGWARYASTRHLRPEENSVEKVHRLDSLPVAIFCPVNNVIQAKTRHPLDERLFNGI